MSKEKITKTTLHVKGIDISITSTGKNDNDYISLTDMLKAKASIYNHETIKGYLQNATEENIGIQYLNVKSSLSNIEVTGYNNHMNQLHFLIWLLWMQVMLSNLIIQGKEVYKL